MTHDEYPNENDFLDEDMPLDEPELDLDIDLPEADDYENYVEEEILGEDDWDAVSDVYDDRFITPELYAALTADDQALDSAGLTESVNSDAQASTQPTEDTAPSTPDQTNRDAFIHGQDFEDMLKKNTNTTKSHNERPAHKGRPARKKGDGLLSIPHMLATLVWLAIIVAIGVSLGRMIWVCASDVLAFGKEEKTVTVSIQENDTIDDIANALHDAGLVRYPNLFKLYAKFTVDDGEISPGTFTLNTVYDYHALVKGMSPSSSTRVVVEDVLIPEGYNCRQIFALLEEKGICTSAALEEYAANGELKDYWFLKDVARGDKYCLEGYLFPDTYDFYENDKPQRVLEKLLNNFEAKFKEDMQAQLTTLNERLSEKMRKNGCSKSYIAENQMTIRDVVIVASLIEEETGNDNESYTIASVIYNRLTQDQEFERYLNIDAAIFYALGEHKEALTAEDLQIDSPYNTYTHAGLTPGPITCPGLASLKAALDPEDSSYYYYVLDPANGSHIFASTLEEHEKNVEEVKQKIEESKKKDAE